MHTDIWTPAYIALGSNLNDPLHQVRAALDALHHLPKTRFFMRSKWYCSEPMGPQEQPEFVNAAAAVLTQLTATELFVELKRIEAGMGRKPDGLRWGPRVIDLDLLVFGAQRIESEALTVPHVGIAIRNFVLIPLADIAPEMMVPGVGRVANLAARVGSSGLVEIK